MPFARSISPFRNIRIRSIFACVFWPKCTGFGFSNHPLDQNLFTLLGVREDKFLWSVLLKIMSCTNILRKILAGSMGRSRQCNNSLLTGQYLFNHNNTLPRPSWRSIFFINWFYCSNTISSKKQECFLESLNIAPALHTLVSDSPEVYLVCSDFRIRLLVLANPSSDDVTYFSGSVLSAQ